MQWPAVEIIDHRSEKTWVYDIREARFELFRNNVPDQMQAFIRPLEVMHPLHPRGAKSSRKFHKQNSRHGPSSSCGRGKAQPRIITSISSNWLSTLSNYSTSPIKVAYKCLALCFFDIFFMSSLCNLQQRLYTFIFNPINSLCVTSFSYLFLVTFYISFVKCHWIKLFLDDDDEFEFEFEFYCPLLFYQLGQEKKLKQPKRKQNAENKRETKMRPNMIKWEEKAIFQHAQQGGLAV